jgi:hypothetical protein
MATSGPMTYLVMEDQFPSVAAPRERLPTVRDCRARSSAVQGVSCGLSPRTHGLDQVTDASAVATAPNGSDAVRPVRSGITGIVALLLGSGAPRAEEALGGLGLGDGLPGGRQTQERRPEVSDG